MRLVASRALVDDPAAVTPADRFFATLYDGQSGILELRTIPIDQSSAYERGVAARCRDFVPVENGRFNSKRIELFIKNTAGRKMAAYFGVALRTPQAAIDRKGSAAYCQTLTALFVDADFKHLGEDETRQRLAAFPIPPSIIVNSGGGLHPYWVLRRPFFLQHDYEKARSMLRRLAKGVAEIVDESVSEPARVLRIPGSYNFKYGDPRLVVLEKV